MPAEASHFLRGVLFREYLESPLSRSLAETTRSFQERIPALGAKAAPSIFPILEGMWMRLFGVSRLSILLLMCAVAAGLGLLIFRATSRDATRVVGGFAALSFVCLPLVRELYSSVGPELMQAALLFGSTLAFADLIHRGHAADALRFGAWASLALVQASSAITLVVMAGSVLANTRGWSALARPALWGGVAFAAALAAVLRWSLQSGEPLTTTWALRLDWNLVLERTVAFPAQFALSAGVVMLLVMLGGAAVAIGPSLGPRWKAAVALVAGLYVQSLFLPEAGKAHVLSALPPSLMLAAAGINFATRRKSLGPAVVGTVCAGLLGGTLLLTWPEFRPKAWRGFSEMAELLAEEQIRDSPVVLIASDARGEAIFAAELALAGELHRMSVKSASSLLAEPGGRTNEFRARFAADEMIAARLKRAQLDYVVLDDSMSEEERTPLQDVLRRVVENQSDRYRHAGEAAVVRDGFSDYPPLRLYRVRR